MTGSSVVLRHTDHGNKKRTGAENDGDVVVGSAQDRDLKMVWKDGKNGACQHREPLTYVSPRDEEDKRNRESREDWRDERADGLHKFRRGACLLYTSPSPRD